MRKLILTAVGFVMFWSAVAQEKTESNPISYGKLSGTFRNYYLGTYNKGNLKSFNAIASGLKLKYEYHFGEWLTLGGAMYSSLNWNVQDLTIADPTTGKLSRYESGLFDLENRDDNFIAFPGELYAIFQLNQHQLTVGRMKIKSPMINPQDGRMIPTLEQGLWYKYADNGILSKFQLGVFNAIAPRSSKGYFKIGNSLGVYPIGRGWDGKPSHYKGNTNSNYVMVANLQLQPIKGVQWDTWNYYVDNIFNTLYSKGSWNISDTKWQIAAEYMHQSKVGQGGNAIDSLKYYNQQNSNLWGIQFSYKTKTGMFKLGYDRILPRGRFLFPREWGREDLFSFQKRERSEGAADNKALVFTYDMTTSFGKDKLRSIISVGHQWKPSVLNPSENKYAMPSYAHFNLDLFYTTPKLAGLKPELLLVYKTGYNKYPDNMNFVINKVDLFQVNFIVNYTF